MVSLEVIISLLAFGSSLATLLVFKGKITVMLDNYIGETNKALLDAKVEKDQVAKELRHYEDELRRASTKTERLINETKKSSESKIKKATEVLVASYEERINLAKLVMKKRIDMRLQSLKKEIATLAQQQAIELAVSLVGHKRNENFFEQQIASSVNLLPKQFKE